MFNKYYYARHDNDIIVYSLVYQEHDARMALYKNANQIDVAVGRKGDFYLEGQGLRLRINNTNFKSTHELTIEKKITALHPVKLKELRRILTDAQIFNALNPTKAQTEAQKFKWNRLILPVLMILLSVIMQYFIRDGGKFMNLIPMLPNLVAGVTLYNMISEYTSLLNTHRYGPLGGILVLTVLCAIISEFLFSFVI